MKELNESHFAKLTALEVEFTDARCEETKQAFEGMEKLHAIGFEELGKNTSILGYNAPYFHAADFELVNQLSELDTKSKNSSEVSRTCMSLAELGKIRYKRDFLQDVVNNFDTYMDSIGMSPPPLEKEEKEFLSNRLSDNALSFDSYIQKKEAKLQTEVTGLVSSTGKRPLPQPEVERPVIENLIVEQQVVAYPEAEQPANVSPQEPDKNTKTGISLDDLKDDVKNEKPANLGNGRVSFMDSAGDIFKSIIRELVTGIVSAFSGDPLAKVQADYNQKVKGTILDVPVRSAPTRK
ncbi:MAG: hypothetical protein FWG93_00100 [Oscillospiraceae bacterium]|nr:hypothetical protein [Oscillospiraceae bacterium]